MIFTRRQFMQVSAATAGTHMLAGCGRNEEVIGSDMSTYTPDLDSLNSHQNPKWFKDAKLGIFIHWGPYSVPAFAPVGQAITDIGEGGSGFMMNPYAEWYQNTLLFEDGPTAAYHRETFGEDYSYENFGAAYNESLENWDPDAWVDLFVRAGAKYVVLVSKHHDGFLLWPSEMPNPFIPNWGTTRDVVGELAEATRARGLKFGIYYSGGIDWTFKHIRIESLETIFANVPFDVDGYTAYADAHYQELIRRYRPDYLWNDIAYPSQTSFLKIAADYYNIVPDGLINDRWITPQDMSNPRAFERPDGVTGLIPPEPILWDVRTPEYGIFDRVLPFDWETTRGLGKSFGYNRQETADDLLAPSDLIEMMSQAACYNGNVLLNVGPRGDATIDPDQASRLESLGAWLGENGEAVYGTRPVILPENQVGGVPVGATASDDATYLHLMGPVEGSDLSLPLPEGANVAEAMLMSGKLESWSQTGGRLIVTAERWADNPTQIVKLNLA